MRFFLNVKDHQLSAGIVAHTSYRGLTLDLTGGVLKIPHVWTVEPTKIP